MEGERTVEEITAQSALKQMQDVLEKIPRQGIAEPRVRVSVVLEEAQELAGLLSRHEVARRLADVGVAAERVQELEPATQALREAEAEWLRARAHGKSAERARAESEGYALRDELLSACRFNLADCDIFAELARITDGEDAQDLRHDLLELAELVENHIDCFRSDRSFAATCRIEEARLLSEQIGYSEELSAPDDDARILRNRAFTYLIELMQQLREAGLYAFRGSTQARRYFATHLSPARRSSELPSMVRTRSA